MKNYDADTTSAIVADTAKIFWFADLELDSQTYRYSDIDFDIYHDRDTDDFPELLSNGEFLTYTGSSPSVNWSDWSEIEDTGAADWDYDGGAEMTVDTQPTSREDLAIRQTATIDASHDYVCRYSVTGASGNAESIRIDALEASSPFTVHAYDTATCDGTRQTGEFKIDATGDTSMYIRISFAGVPDAGDSLVVHEISLKRVQQVVYQPNDFEVSEISFSADMAVDRAQIEFQNVDLAMSAILLNETAVNRSLRLAFGCLDSSNQIIALENVFKGFITGWGPMSVASCPISIGNYFMFWSKKSLRLAQATCPWAFKSTNNSECGYSGSETECNKSYSRCAQLSNTNQFGGFRFIPGLQNKKIYWGRYPWQDMR